MPSLLLVDPLVTAKPAPPPGQFLLTVSRSILAVRFDFSSLLIVILVRLYRLVSGSGVCRTFSLLSLQSFFGGINHVIAVRFSEFSCILGLIGASSWFGFRECERTR